MASRSTTSGVRVCRPCMVCICAPGCMGCSCDLMSPHQREHRKNRYRQQALKQCTVSGMLVPTEIMEALFQERLGSACLDTPQGSVRLPVAHAGQPAPLFLIAGMTELCPMGTIGGLKGTLGPLTKEQRLAIKSKQVMAPQLSPSLGTASPTRQRHSRLGLSPLAMAGMLLEGGQKDFMSRKFCSPVRVAH